MQYWWVNQNQTYKTEVPGGFLWSPKTRKDGGRNHFYVNMTLVQPGDVVFSFCDTLIKAVGVATGQAQSTSKPDFGKAGSDWATDGWLVPVEFNELGNTIRPKEHMEVISPHLPVKYSPLQANGNGLQSVYLANVPASLAQVLIELIGEDYQSSVAAIELSSTEEEIDDGVIVEAIEGRTDLDSTTKEQLVQSRRGQGLFKANLRLNEMQCRVTGVTELNHLRASHIKPWRDCTDEEKLNGCNGLLLAPHIDHLFDQGYISFTDNGDLLVSTKLSLNTIEAWGINIEKNVGVFNEKQVEFLDYHRKHIFKTTD